MKWDFSITQDDLSTPSCEPLWDQPERGCQEVEGTGLCKLSYGLQSDERV